MAYPKNPAFSELVSRLALYSQLQHERGAKNISPILKRAERDLQSALAELKRLPIDEAMADREPNDLPSIKSLRPRGPRRLWEGIDRKQFEGKCEGALLGRMAGCTLGAPVPRRGALCRRGRALCAARAAHPPLDPRASRAAAPPSPAGRPRGRVVPHPRAACYGKLVLDNLPKL